MSINSDIKIHVCPWSPVSDTYGGGCESCADLFVKPGWMKDSGTMNGGKFYTSLSDICRPRAPQ